MSVSEQSIFLAAQEYIKRGFKLFPVHGVVKTGGRLTCTCGNAVCRSPAKHPVAHLVPHGVKDATNDLAIIEKWYNGHVQYNIGLATGGENGVVIDVDTKGNGPETLKALEAKHGPLPATLRWHTGSGGEHIWLRPQGDIIKNSVRQLGSGLDVRGDNGYVVAPPSIHISGGAYILPDGMSFEQPIADAPAWLADKLTERPRPKQQAINDWREIASREVPEGQRNDTITRLCGLLIGKGIEPVVCLGLLIPWNFVRCAPPLSDEEVMGIVGNIFRLEKSKKPNEGRK